MKKFLFNKIKLSKKIYLINKPFFSNETKKKELYHCICEPDNAIIVPIYKNNKFLLVKQKRLPINRSIFEFPMGYIEKNETPANGATRELLEETGFKSLIKPIKIMSLFADPGRNSRKIHIFYSNKILKTDKSEKGITVSFFSKNEINSLINKNLFPSAAHIAAYYNCLIKFFK
jgi:ADP-ribose pyrophosphatase YjhB (NUDIX family)